MLRPIVNKLAGRKVILASSSPRRRDILRHIGFPFEVVPSTFEENLDKSSFAQPWDYAMETSRGKAREVAHRIRDDASWVVIIAADTIVVKDGDIIEKPLTSERAREILHRLNGTTHTVHTGVTLVYRVPGSSVTQEHTFQEEAGVTFGSLTDEVIESYVESGEPLDKAGGYGIQGLGGTLVKSITGDYYNVEGLPLHRLCQELLDGIPPLI